MASFKAILLSARVLELSVAEREIKDRCGADVLVDGRLYPGFLMSGSLAVGGGVTIGVLPMTTQPMLKVGQRLGLSYGSTNIGAVEVLAVI